MRASAVAFVALTLLASAPAPAAAAAASGAFFAAAGDASLVRLVGRWLPAANQSAIGDWAGISAEVRVALNATGGPPFTTLTALLEDGCAGGNKLAAAGHRRPVVGQRPDSDPEGFARHVPRGLVDRAHPVCPGR